ncbi:glycoside hydrolase family 2 protein [Bacteroides xylanisolvens]|uniref:glycoside hydrolase family 2 protein n=1 Tax=Bacteroides xylanisolvens TaxID=371601 RepID=UPI001B8C9F68|nr:sugar-binding domain-containing protein [Bacteroides xylanisolvens]QUT27395.1 Beta-glucuronidase [Bacteroides xylanisolvens]
MKHKLFLFTFLLAILSAINIQASERKKYNFNSEWKLRIGDFPKAKDAKFDDSKWKQVTLPHAFNEDEAFKLSIEQLTDTVVWYRKSFRIPELKSNQKVFVEFEGVRQRGDFYLNGHYLGRHENGVMAVGFDLTPHIKEGENVIAVRTDNNWMYREEGTNSKFQWNDRNFNANYGGIPKNVFLYVTDNVYQTLPLYSNLKTTGVYVYAQDFDIQGRKATIHAESEVRNDSKASRQFSYQVTVLDADGKLMKTFQGDKVTLKAGETKTVKASATLHNLHFWSWGYGYLYTVKTALKDDNNQVFDEVSTRTGFRKTRFAEGKIWLNDRIIQMKGYAQRTSNEWPAVGLSVPAWLSDFSNDLMVKGNANLVRWMHVTPWKQDVESCDRVGLIQAMPAGDAEKDREGRQWEQRVELMRDAIIYNRNNPSILFYECGNKAISREHMIEMKAVRDKYDPFGGRAIGSREMLDIREAEYGGEMLYINRSEHHPMWATEYCRDEGLRKYWDEYSYPFHKEGDGPLYKGQPATDYNRNQDELAITMIARWYDYWRERPGTGNRVSSGGTKIIFSDTNTHYRGAENYRRSGVTDAMRIEKDAFYAHQVMWDGWVDTEKDQTYIIGHWNYPDNTVKPVQVVSTGEEVELFLNGNSLGKGKRQYNFLFTFDNVAFKPGKLEAVSYNKAGKEISRYAVNTAGEPASLKLTAIQNPEGFHADGADMTLIQVEVVDKDGQRCPLDNRTIQFTLKGQAEWRGGIAQGKNNHILDTNLPVECGINRALIRSTTAAGKVTLTAQAKGLLSASLTLETVPVKVTGGLSTYLPQATLKGRLDRGETPSTPSYKDSKKGVRIVSAKAGSNNNDAEKSYDDIELTEWKNDGKLSTAWITYTLERDAEIDDICIKLQGWRSRSYPLEVYAGNTLIWSGNTDKSLGYIHLNVEKPVRANTITIRLKGNTSDKDAFGQIIEVEAIAANTMELEKSSSKHQLRIIEVEFLETIK